MGKLRTRVGLGAAVVGIGLALGAPAFADGTGFQITSPQTGSTISGTPTVKGLGQPGARVAVEAVRQGNNDNHHWNNGNGNQPGNNGPGSGPGNNGPGNNGPGNGPGSNGPGNNGPGNGPGSNGPGNQWNGSSKQPEENSNAAAGRCNTTVGQNGWWSCTISPRLSPGRYRIVARQSMPGAGNDVASVDNLLVPGGQLPVTPGPDPVPVVAGGLVLLAGGAVVVAATRTRRRGKHAA